MKFGFMPYLNNKNIDHIINGILNKLYEITFEDINNYIKQGLKTLDKINIGKKKNIISNQLRFGNINKWKKHWNIINSSFELLYNQYHDKYNSPFEALIHFNENNCKIFANWLELYSLSNYLFKQINSYNFYKNNDDIVSSNIPGKKEINKLLNIFRNVDWTIIDLKSINTYKYNKRNVV